MNVNLINLRQWRQMCGVVMQDGKTFNDTVLNKIVLDDEHIDYDRLREVCNIAQFAAEINELPKGFETMIGNHQTLMEKKGHYFNLVSTQMA